MTTTAIKDLDWKSILNKFNASEQHGTFFDYFYREYYGKLLPEYENDNNIEKFSYNLLEINKFLLKKLSESSPEMYKKVHKGTPYYFVGMFSFLTHNYEQAVFFMNAAVLEDKKNSETWETYAAYSFFILDEKLDYFKNFISELRRKIELEIKKFNHYSSFSVSLNKFIDFFVKPLLRSTETQSIITSIYSFILEKEDIDLLLLTRSDRGGTIEPIILHLFKGSVIVESLLKLRFINEMQLGSIYRHTDFKTDYVDVGSISSTNLNEIVSSNEFIQTNVKAAFSITGKIRNTTAHKLSWDDVFEKYSNYEIMYNHIVSAMFYIIKQEYEL